ncbi:PREDICTED: uncharacterized protein LOC104825710 [Tarenaya hassleriana]|uniref:uncharacterized protein LOC104825710 n=1 Tax=Tarenaya hassleriana TaxID=28532 RepID=UPI00053C66A6|nr:PREDICTED: uncharacterized protein LOC104825710 [Tarenaya hassleriana]
MATEQTNSADTTATTFDAREPTKTLLSVNMSNVTKLISTNYITWSLQIRALLEGHKLDCFITDDGVVPPAKIDNTGVLVDNPAFANFKQQDRLLFSAILGTISLNLQPVVARSTSIRDAWKTISNIYGKASRGHLLQLREQVKRCIKGSQTVDEFIRFVTTKSDELAILGKPLDHEDILDAIISGLPEEYKPVVDIIQAKDVAVSIEEFYEKLLQHEAKLATTANSFLGNFPATANVAHARGRQNYRGSGRGQQWSRFGQTPSKGYQGKCQACGVFGHSAQRCYLFRLVSASDNAGQGPPPTSPWQASPRPWQPTAHDTAMSATTPRHGYLIVEPPTTSHQTSTTWPFITHTVVETMFS